MRRTLYVTDMDGTLLNNGSFVSQRSSDIITDLSHDGALITVATARTPATVVPMMSSTFTTVPYVVLTGGALYDHAAMRYVNFHSIPHENLTLLYSLYEEAGVSPFVYHMGSDGMLVVYHAPQMSAVEQSFYTPRSSLRLKRFVFQPLTYSAQNTPVVLLFATGEHNAMFALAEKIRQTQRFSVSCYPDIFNPKVALLEVYDAGVSKAFAVQRLMKSVGAERLVVFGDNLNDLPMLEVADVAVAVANANSQVKDAADIIIGSNSDDSVARFILYDYYNNCG